VSFPAAIDLRRARMPRISMRPISARVRRPSRWTLILSLLILAAVIAGGFMLVRNSSLVAVDEVKVVGLSGYYDKDARSAVVAEAMQMTTMNFDPSKIEDAASGFVDVAGVKVETDFPHAATIYVHVRRPVLIARLTGRTVTLSQDGEVITAPASIAGLPRIQASGNVVDGRVTGGKALSASTLLGAAPDVLMRKVDGIRWGRYGIVVSMEKGPDLYFGTSADAKLKWRDAATVLASDASTGAAYLDLRVPGRPAVGGLGAAPSTITGQAIVEPTPDQAATDTSGTADSTATDTPAATPAPATQTAPAQQTPAPTTTQQAPAAGAGGAGPNG
jgi:cell division septal protein FtsQ